MKSRIMNQRTRNILLTLSAFILVSAAILFTLTSVFRPELQRNENKSSSYTVNMAEKVIERDKEIRAMWIASVSNINFPSTNTLSASQLKTEIDAILSTLLENSMNTVILQVRPASDALYLSDIFPSSEYIVSDQGQPFPEEIDILEYLVTEAHKLDIAVCAWVNPLRVTTNTTDISSLAENNPARVHPEYTVSYDGALYYDPGLPEVRALITQGVKEIADSYEVDAIVFDDYFYPYPSEDKEFDDTISYIKYGSSLPLEQWRRENINKLIEDCYNAVSGRCFFGISPFGIWRNNDGVNGGSDTNGLSAYDEIYCDALAWIEGGYIDFISPQIYWDFDDPNAPFAELADWWDEKLSGTDIALIISHAAYKIPEWQNAYEIPSQIEYARTKSSYLGSAIYGYAVIASNTEGICDTLKEIY